MEGFLFKQGVRGPVNGYKKRWFTQKGTSLHYFKNKSDPNKLGEIDITTALSCEITEQNTREPKYRFQINTPKRIWLLAADNSEKAQIWVDGIIQIIREQEKQELNTAKRRSVATSESRIRDLESRNSILTSALKIAAEKLNVDVKDLIKEAEVTCHKKRSSENEDLKAEKNEEKDKQDNVVLQETPLPFQARVLYNYNAQQDFEMTISTNEKITVLSKHPNGWWLGLKHDKQRGYFPCSYVEIIENEPPSTEKKDDEVHSE